MVRFWVSVALVVLVSKAAVSVYLSYVSLSHVLQ